MEQREFIDLAESPDSSVSRELSSFSLRASNLFQEIEKKRQNDYYLFRSEFKVSLPRDHIKSCPSLKMYIEVSSINFLVGCSPLSALLSFAY